MKRSVAGLLAMVGIAVWVRVAMAEDKTEAPAVTEQSAEARPQTECPVLGGAIDPKLFVEYGGRRVYLCCAGCIDAFNKDPEKYVKKLEAEGVTLEKVQTTCPVMDGNKITKELYVDHNGKRIYFCCGACPGMFKKDPETYMKKMSAEGVTPEPAPEAAAAGK